MSHLPSYVTPPAPTTQVYSHLLLVTLIHKILWCKCMHHPSTELKYIYGTKTETIFSGLFPALVLCTPSCPCDRCWCNGLVRTPGNDITSENRDDDDLSCFLTDQHQSVGVWPPPSHPPARSDLQDSCSLRGWC